LKAGFDAEFLTRPDGYEGLKECYGFEFSTEPMQMDPGLMYQVVNEGSVDVIDAFATDGRIEAYDLKVLEDDKNFFPPYYAAPLVRADALKECPEIEEVLGKLAGRISNKVMQKLNYRVDEKGEKAYRVARSFLEEKGLIQKGDEPADDTARKVVVGGKQFTEQEVLGQIMAILIECKTDIEVERRLNLGGTMICFSALRAGDIDLYAEYTGTGLVNIMKHDVISSPEKAYNAVKDYFKQEYGLIWMAPFGFNNTYTLTMRQEQAEELGIETISDLAEYVRSQEGG